MIIGLSGKIGSGKSTVSNVFQQNGFILDSFAKSVKDVSHIVFGFDRDKLDGITQDDRNWRETPDQKYSDLLGKNFSPRDSLILIGTSFGRDILNNDIWIHTLFNRYEKYADRNILITDVRFPNEYKEIKKRGGIVIRINRDNNTYFSTHESECSLDDYSFDHVIQNNSTVDELIKKTQEIVNIYIVKPPENQNEIIRMRSPE